MHAVVNNNVNMSLYWFTNKWFTIGCTLLSRLHCDFTVGVMYGPELHQPFCRCDHGFVGASADAVPAHQHMEVA